MGTTSSSECCSRVPNCPQLPLPSSALAVLRPWRRLRLTAASRALHARRSAAPVRLAAPRCRVLLNAIASARRAEAGTASRSAAAAAPPRLRAARPARLRQAAAQHRAVRAAAAAAVAADELGAEARTIGSAALALALCNMRRVCMSVAVLPIAQALGWQPAVQARPLGCSSVQRSRPRRLRFLTPLRRGTHQGLVQSSFLWGYSASQIQGGILADRLGGKAVIAAAIAFFSAATLLTPLSLSAAVRRARACRAQGVLSLPGVPKRMR
jgi:hypothetical protein